jgi:hypothetical protein
MFIRRYDHYLVDGFPKTDYTSLIVIPEKPTYLRIVKREAGQA